MENRFFSITTPCSKETQKKQRASVDIQNQGFSVFAPHIKTPAGQAGARLSALFAIGNGKDRPVGTIIDHTLVNGIPCRQFSIFSALAFQKQALAIS